MSSDWAKETERLVALDPGIAAVVDQLPDFDPESRFDDRDEELFAALARIVVGQQVSTAAARTIWGRLVERFDGPPTPAAVVDAEDDLRASGLSGRKASYLIGIAAEVESGALDLDDLAASTDEDAIERLVALRGLGRWSAEMFLLFHMRRPDVFSGGDLGLRKGVQVVVGLTDPPSPEQAAEIAERWSPHRSLACLYLWESVHVGLPPADPRS